MPRESNFTENVKSSDSLALRILGKGNNHKNNPQYVRWIQPGHKIAGIQSSQAERGHKEPRKDRSRSQRVQSEGFIVRSLNESRTRVASECKNDIIILHRNLLAIYLDAVPRKVQNQNCGNL